MIAQYLLDLYHKGNQEILLLIIMLILVIPIVLFIKKVLFPMIKGYINKLHHGDQFYEKILKKHKIYEYLLHALLSMYFIFWGNILHSSSNSYLLIAVKNIFLIIYTGISFTLLILVMIDAAIDIYQKTVETATRLTYITVFIQILKIIIIAIAAIIIISNILNISLGTFFTSLGAATALLTFLFKDAVTSLLASLQLISQDIVRIGDFVTMPQNKVEGTIEKITITVVKIRNPDQTISTIPTASMLNTLLINSCGIKDSKAMRIQRSLYIDMNSIIFIELPFIEALSKSPYLVSNLLNKINIENFNNKMTNIKIFRLYVKEYLKNNPAIYQQDFTFLVRELQPTHSGLPIELYVFTNKLKIDIYEELQADIFDHLFAILPEFKLKIFQK
jgi:miniconductance mechanosensitive channel